MRVLLLRRQSTGPLAAHVDDLVATLPAYGVTAVVADAADWIPEQINRQVDRQVAKELRERGNSFDLVHAFGYRCAWAAAETYEEKEAWLYSVHDLPRSVHPFLVERLNWAQRSVVASRAVRDALEGATVRNPEVINPGYLPAASVRLPADARRYYELPTEGLLVGVSAGREVVNATREDSGIDAVFEAWTELKPEGAHLVVLGDPPSMLPQGAIALGPISRGAEAIGMCDLWIESGRNLGWSRTLSVAMERGRSCLVREEGALPEIIADEVSGMLFASDEALPARLSELLEFEITREAFGNAARVRFEERFSMRQSAERVVAVYRQIAGEA
jgi:glycosyltransferase involved in cell wall biosynthesis